MTRFKLGLLLIVMIQLCSCQVNAQSTVRVNGSHADNPALQKVIVNYFQAFDNIHQWSAFATDDFIKQVYELCSGDQSGSKSIAEMKKIYFEINRNSLKLAVCTINEIDKVSPIQADIYVTRKWENGQKDTTAYSIILVNQEWRFDQRF